MSDLVERLGGAASGLDYIAMLIENGSIDQGSERQSSAVARAAENVRDAIARITELETSLAEAEGRVISEVAAWLRNACHEGSLADDLETGEWKK